MGEWKTYRLGEICDVRDGTHDSPKQSLTGKPLVTSKNIKGGIINLSSTYLISNEDYQSINKRSCVHQWDILFSMIGTVGELAIVKNEPQFAIKNIGLFKMNGDQLLSYWIYYYLHSDNAQENILKNIKGSTQQYIALKDLRLLPIGLPPIEIRQRIVEILKSFDDKIELNRRINANLEAQAQALFRSWFVDNDNQLGNYQTKSLTDIAQYLNGLAMQKFPSESIQNSLPVLKIKELGQGLCDASSDRCSTSIKPEYVINDGDVIFSWSGTLLVDVWCGGKCGLNQHLFKVTSDNYPKWFIFYWTKHHLDKFIRIAKDKAVTMGHIKRCDLESSEVKVPEKSILEYLDKIFTPLFDSMITHRIENRKLSALRDTLLPKLMAGEIKI